MWAWESVILPEVIFEPDQVVATGMLCAAGDDVGTGCSTSCLMAMLGWSRGAEVVKETGLQLDAEKTCSGTGVGRMFVGGSCSMGIYVVICIVLFFSPDPKI